MVRFARRAALLTAFTTALLTTPMAPAGAHGGVDGEIRVDQVGYTTHETKQAYLMTDNSARGEKYRVVDARGRTVLSGRVGRTAGEWNDQFGAVHRLDVSDLRKAGQYRVIVGHAKSPVFSVGSGQSLFASKAANATKFFQVQRDGADVVPETLDRKPSHLADSEATVYHEPVFTGEGGDEIAEPLVPVEGAAPVDVEGGWFDAGDYVKFTHASAYSTAGLLYAQRSRSRDRALADETQFGLDWLDKMWDADNQVLYVQVGIGTGSEEFDFLGDHDVWRLPEADDALDVEPGDSEYFLKHRPVFRAAAPGEEVSPNLAGRMSAAFALGAQNALASGDRHAARHWLDEAATLYAQADTTDVGELVTAFPHAYYPEDSWVDDMEFGAVELAIAGKLLGDPRARGWTNDAKDWADAYIEGESGDTLNLYDTSALAHTDLIHLTGRNPRLVADLKRQLDVGVEGATANPLDHAVDVSQFDAASRSFGFAATAHLYRSVSGDNSYDAFGTRQRNFTLGSNAWGTGLVVGAGTTFPHCPQHQVANLSGSLTGDRRAVITGGVVNGPNGAENFEFIGIPDGANACEVDFTAGDTETSRYLDDVRAWPSSEPAIDFVATSALAFALTARN